MSSILYYFYSGYDISIFYFVTVTVTKQSQLGLLLSLVTLVTVTYQSQLGLVCDSISLPCHSHLQLSQIQHTTLLTSTSLWGPSQRSPHSSSTAPPIYIKFLSFSRLSIPLQLLLLPHPHSNQNEPLKLISP